MSKRNAFFLHFCISAIVVSTVLAVIAFVWYPAPLFELLGAWSVIRVLVGVDLMLGPALTLLLYRPGKPKLLLDMSVVVLIQIAALSYGISVIYSERPCYMVYAVDRFEAVSCSHIDEAELLANTAIPAKDWSEPLYVEARMPSDPQAVNRLIDEVVLQGKPDIAERPAHWLPFTADTFAAIKHKYLSVAQLTLDAPAQAEADKLMQRYGDKLIIVPLTAKDNSVALVLSPASLRAVGTLPVDVWALRKDEQKKAAKTAAE